MGSNFSGKLEVMGSYGKLWFTGSTDDIEGAAGDFLFLFSDLLSVIFVLFVDILTKKTHEINLPQ